MQKVSIVGTIENLFYNDANLLYLVVNNNKIIKIVTLHYFIYIQDLSCKEKKFRYIIEFKKKTLIIRDLITAYKTICNLYSNKLKNKHESYFKIYKLINENLTAFNIYLIHASS